ncbi:MAG: sialate O-acetylesterase, partial [Planctomycetota bacterium]
PVDSPIAESLDDGRNNSTGRAAQSSYDQSQLRLLHLIGGARGSSGSYTRQHLSCLTPESFCEGRWRMASAESARDFSAVAWFFGKHLQQNLKVPVGVICPAVGGTPTEAWIPRESLESDAELKGLVAGNWLDNERLGEFCRTRGVQNLLAAMQAGESIPADDGGPNHPFKPGFMWEAGIQPLIPYAIRGAIWYQGESNAETPDRVREHTRLFPLLIHSWRQHWGQGDFPFLYVQLPALNRPEWPLFREGQRRLLGELDNVGMAITIDTGHPSNVHPTWKRPVGERLAKWALGTTYMNAVVEAATLRGTDAGTQPLASPSLYSGPLFDSAQRKDGMLVLRFQHSGNRLKSSDGKGLRHFEVCGDDGIFHPASAKVIEKHSIALTSPNVANPRHARYAWLPWPDPPVNLFNSANLPASPFSTQSADPVFSPDRLSH